MDVANGKREGNGVPEFPVVGIGASAGGLKAAQTLLENTPIDTGMAFVLVFHLDPKHKSEAAALLQRHTRMPVAQVEGRTRIEPNHVYVIPPNHGLSLVDGGLVLTAPKRADGRPTVIDHFFRTLAEHAGEHAIGIVLSGTGSEGSQGLKAIKEAGGLAVVQDETEADYSGMPHSAIATGLIDFVLPVAEIPAKLLEVRDSTIDFVLPDDDRAAGDSDADILQKIFVQLRTRVGHDFSQYKQNTVLRRIVRRMQVHQLQTLGAYLDLLRETPVEAAALFRELLISVTNFFRDPEAMGALAHDVMPQLCQRLEGQAVRLWVPGCATGEEAYSLAMLLGEACDGLASPPRLQIFATDVDEHALDIARRGLYPGAIVGDVSEARLKRFFDREGDGFVVKGFLREMILFSRHDLLQNPPFSRLDLISCRNLLIYLKTGIQSKVFALFHFALKPQSYLFLGSSESVGSAGKLFSEIDRKAKIFQSRRVPVTDLQFPLLSGAARVDAKRQDRDEPRKRFEEIVRDELLVHYAPPCVIVGENHDLTYISGRVGKYLEPGAGVANYNILDMAREGLRLELRGALFKAFHDGESVRRKPVRVRNGSGEEQILLTVRPLAEVEGHVLVVFEETGGGPEAPLQPRPAGDDDTITQLEAELTSTRESLQTSIEELETSNEELRASNEELQSMNEELQSTTEELETGKEELQSTNEELLAVNQELQTRNDDLARANADLSNLVASTGIAILFLDGGLRVRRFSPRMTGIFNLIASDVGRPLAHLTHNLKAENLVADAERVLRDLVMVERELASKDGCFYQTRLRPYRTIDNKVDGVVVTFVDVSERRHHEAQTQTLNLELEAEKAFVESIIATVREPMLVLDGELRVVSASRAFYRDFKAVPESTEHVLLYELAERQWDVQDLRHVLEEILPERTNVEDFEVRHDFGGGERSMLLNATRLQQADGATPLILLSFEDITERRHIELALEDKTARLHLALDAAETGTFIWYPEDDRSEPDERMLELFGQPPDGTLDLASAFAATIHPDDHERFAAAIADAIDPAGEGMLDEEIRLVLPGDVRRWVAIRAQVRFEGDPRRAVRMPGVAWNITERKRHETNLAFLAEIGEDLVRMLNVEAAMATLGAKIAAHFNASACTFGEVDEDEQFIDIIYEWQRTDVPGRKGRHRISDFHGEEFRQACRAGEIYAVRDTATDPRVDPDSMAACSVGSFVSVPLLRGGQWRFQMTISDAAPRNWREDEIKLACEIGVRIWMRLERARAEQALGESEARYRTLFDSIDEGFCIVKLFYDDAGNPFDYRFLEVNPAFHRNTGLGNVVGKTIRQMVPKQEQQWFDIFGAIAASGEPMRFEQRAAGMQRWFDVYAFRVGEPEQHRVAVLFTDISRRKHEENAVARLASIVDSTDDAIISKDLEGIVTSWNSSAEWMFGYSAEEAIGKPISALIIPEGRMAEEDDILRRIARGEAIEHFETVRRRKDGSRLDISVTISPLTVAGRVVGASKIARDITERKRAEQHRDLLINELNHRVKNTLATVQSLAMQTFKGPGTKRALETFDARLLALSAAHNVLTRESWKGAGIREIVHNATEAWSGGAMSHLDVNGPELRLRPAAALALAMALHELATNATKYGALSNNAGKVSVHWAVSDDDPANFKLQWLERGGPPVRAPSTRGFGTRLIEFGLAQDLGGTVELAFNDAGVECTIDAPLDDICEEDAPRDGQYR
ncbi:MAG: chemotaxis protein CheB [Rhodanobacteraceae bacterium]